jgi:hypothetical protein
LLPAESSPSLGHLLAHGWENAQAAVEAALLHGRRDRHGGARRSALQLMVERIVVAS